MQPFGLSFARALGTAALGLALAWPAAAQQQQAPANTFDCILSDLEPTGIHYGIDLVDPDRAERLPDGSLRAEVISWDESVRRYGKTAA